jgi:hypothetical protein
MCARAAVKVKYSELLSVGGMQKQSRYVGIQIERGITAFRIHCGFNLYAAAFC